MPGNPFRGYLQAYLQHQQAQHQLDLSEKAHDLAVQQLEELHNYHQGELKRQQAELEQRKNVAAMTMLQHHMENVASGLQQPPENAQVTGGQTGYDVMQSQQPGSETPDIQNLPQTHTLVGPTSFTPSGYSYTLSKEDLGGLASSLSPADRQINVASPEQMSQIAARQAGAKKTAEVQAEMPEKEAERAAKQKEAETRASAGEIAATIRAQAQRDVAEGKNAALLDRMNHIDATRKYVADHNLGNNVDEGELSNYVEKVANGEADLKDIPAKYRVHAQTVLNNQGKVEFTKAKRDQISALNEFDGLTQDMHTAASMLPDSGSAVGNIVEQIGNKAISKLPWQTDIKNAMAAVKAKAPGIVRGVGGVGSGRVTNVEIQAQMDNLINAGMTKQQAEGKIANFERDTYTKAYSDLMSNVPTQQKISILSRNGGLDRWRHVNIRQRDGSVGPVIKKMPNGHETIYDQNTDQYKDIENYK